MLLQFSKVSTNQMHTIRKPCQTLTTCLDGFFVSINSNDNSVRPAQLKDPRRQPALSDRAIQIASSRPTGQQGENFMGKYRNMGYISESIGKSNISHFLPLIRVEYTTKDRLVNKNIAFLRR